MKIAIVRTGDNINCMKDYSDIQDKGEVAHILAELEVIKMDLLEIWEDINGD